MSRWILLAWLTVVAPFATLPWLTIAQNQDEVDGWWQSHLAFHLAYIPISVAAAYVAWRLARATASNAIRVMALMLAALEIVALIGHVGELVPVVRNGGLDAGEAVYEVAAHALFGTITPLVTLLAIVLVLVLTIVSSRRTRVAPAG